MSLIKPQLHTSHLQLKEYLCVKGFYYSMFKLIKVFKNSTPHTHRGYLYQYDKWHPLRRAKAAFVINLWYQRVLELKTVSQLPHPTRPRFRLCQPNDASVRPSLNWGDVPFRTSQRLATICLASLCSKATVVLYNGWPCVTRGETPAVARRLAHTWLDARAHTHIQT